MKFFKMVLASALGYILAALIVIGLFVGLVVGLASNAKPDVVIKEKSVLNLKLNYPLLDRARDESPFDAIAALDPNAPMPVGLNDILRSIEQAKDDDKISGIVLDLTSLQSGYGKLMELRNKLDEFKESGKFVYAYSNYFEYKTYYLASVADTVFVNPEGQMLFNGMRAEVTMFANTLKKLGVEMQVIRHGKYKGAVEPYVRETLSEENRHQIKEFIHSIYNNTLRQISESRGISVAHLNEDANSLEMTNVDSYVDKSYLDGAKYKDEFYALMKDRMGVDRDTKVELVSPKKYKKLLKSKGVSTDKVAILYASGDIIVGKADGNQIGSDNLAKELKKLRENDKIKAVVFRIDSRGGSALASDIIWREASLLAAEKPLIVSMSDVAASGGYYIATPAHKIIADATTITGSIGVFGLVPNAEKLLNDKIGVNMEYIGTNDHSDIGRIDRALKADEREYITSIVDNIYNTFVSKVSKGRDMTIGEVDSIAQGRVWTGAMAVEIGLVDELGGIERAVELAAEEAGLEKYKVKEYPKHTDPFEQIVNRMQGNSFLESQLSKSTFGSYLKSMIDAEGFATKHSVQMLMPFDITVSSYSLR